MKKIRDTICLLLALTFFGSLAFGEVNTEKANEAFSRGLEAYSDKRFLEAFYQFPVEILERGGVYLPDHISVEFQKEQKSRPKVIVYERQNNKSRKLLELKLIMVAEE